MVLEPLTENVEVITITPFLRLELLPPGEPQWGLKTSNNLIRIENFVQALSEELTVTRQMVNTIGVDLEDTLASFQAQLENETIERSAADAALQAQILPNQAVVARFSGRVMTAGIGSAFTHNLGKFPMVAVKREIGNGTVDVTNAFDTDINDNSPDQVNVAVGVSGTYTIICVA